MSENSIERSELIAHTSEIVVAHISRNAVPTDALRSIEFSDMISSPAFISATQPFFGRSLLTIHEREDTGTLTHGSGVSPSIPPIHRDCKISDKALPQFYPTFPG